MSEATIPAAHGTAPLEAAKAYVAAWNAHDGEAVSALFDAAGTYLDPTLPGPIGGEHLAAYVTGLVAAFPDLHFAVQSAWADGDRVTLQWRMRGTNSGPLPGAPQPTGGTCDLPGVDVVTVGPAGITSVVGYFDQKTFVEQLGLRVLVVPADEPPLSFGTSTRVDVGRTAVPGALSMTWIEPRSAAEAAEIEARGAQVVEGLAAEPGFIGFVGTSATGRLLTLTAWTSPEAARSAIARNGAHRTAMERMRSGALGVRGFTSIWAPSRLNVQIADCPSCGSRVDIVTGEEAATCACGAEVAVTPYL